jgi:hypothetical protein
MIDTSEVDGRAIYPYPVTLSVQAVVSDTIITEDAQPVVEEDGTTPVDTELNPV